MGNRWTSGEIKYILSNRKEKSVKEMGEEIGRSPSSVAAKLKYLDENQPEVVAVNMSSAYYLGLVDSEDRLSFLNAIEDNEFTLSNYLRGIVDGSGGVYSYSRGLRIVIWGEKELLEAIKDRIPFKSNIAENKGNYTLSLYGNSADNFARFIYKYSGEDRKEDNFNVWRDYSLNRKRYELVSPDGEIVHFYSVSELYRRGRTDLPSRGLIYELIKEKREDAEGWTRKEYK